MVCIITDANTTGWTLVWCITDTLCFGSVECFAFLASLCTTVGWPVVTETVMSICAGVTMGGGFAARVWTLGKGLGFTVFLERISRGEDISACVAWPRFRAVVNCKGAFSRKLCVDGEELKVMLLLKV